MFKNFVRDAIEAAREFWGVVVLAITVALLAVAATWYQLQEERYNTRQLTRDAASAEADAEFWREQSEFWRERSLMQRSQAIRLQEELRAEIARLRWAESSQASQRGEGNPQELLEKWRENPDDEGLRQRLLDELRREYREGLKEPESIPEPVPETTARIPSALETTLKAVRENPDDEGLKRALEDSIRRSILGN